MLGWLISVYRVADEEAVRRTLGAEAVVKVVLGDDVLGDRLAVWQAGLDGGSGFGKPPAVKAVS